jgi:hypothetical protein
MLDFTPNFINSFINTMNDAANFIKEKCPKIYSQKLVEYLFYDFYTENEYLCEALTISRNTASKYLHELSKAGILIEEKTKKTKLYKTVFLYDLMKLW